MTTATQSVFISDSKNTIFANTLDLRTILQKRMIALSGTKKLCDEAKEELVKIISSNLMEKIQHKTRKSVLALPAFQRESNATGRSVLEELVDRCLYLSTKGDNLKSNVCLLKKSDLKRLGLVPVVFEKLIKDVNNELEGDPEVTGGFCVGDPNGKFETEPYVWIGFAFGTLV